MSKSFINNLNKNTEAISTLLKDKEYSDVFDKVVGLSINSLKNGGSIYIAGNGGSASQADHFAGELVGRFFIEGKSLKVYSLSSNTTVITCIANDFSYDEVFSQQLSGQLEENDIFIGLSTSGTSENIIRAIELCNSNGNNSILITGNTDNAIPSDKNITFKVPSQDTPTIQEIHIIILHSLAEEIEKILRIQ
jgi:D-sedoheptulose 7-phosphate isomerase|tara:strand:+ start:2689 stop:3267 length:579 start_codon:yes stop_codon:yes gene_type:complete